MIYFVKAQMKKVCELHIKLKMNGNRIEPMLSDEEQQQQQQ